RERRGHHLVGLGHADGAQGEVQASRPGGDRARVRHPEPCRERLLERRHARPERELPGAQHLEHELLLARADDGLGEWDHTRSRAGCSAYSSESTSASHEAAMMFSLTPIEPHESVPSEASRSTRVTAPVPLVSSRMRTLKLTSSMSFRCGWISPIASRSARSSAWTGPLPSAVRTKRSPLTQILIVASVSTLPSARFSTMQRQDSSRNSGSYSPASLRISNSNEPSA